jgi:uncharacterized membrane protein
MTWRQDDMIEGNPNARLETFCDGVFAIALTLLIIDIKFPSTAAIDTAADFGRALGHIAPSIFAFVLSFLVILISWVNHHSGLKLIKRSCPSFIYANGLLLLSVVFVPFPTSLVGEYLLTNAAAPAVALYDGVLAFQGLAWALLGDSAIRNQLTKSEKAAAHIRVNRRNAYFALAGYSLLGILALWFPLTIAIVTAVSWIFWLVAGMTITHD